MLKLQQVTICTAVHTGVLIYNLTSQRAVCHAAVPNLHVGRVQTLRVHNRIIGYTYTMVLYPHHDIMP